MLWKASDLVGYRIKAIDGLVGTVSDFLFEDDSWLVRWLVVDTGVWLSGRKVLLPPVALGHPDPAHREFPVALTIASIKDSPDIGSDRPVSRQMEGTLYDYYGWRPYWGSGFYLGGFGFLGDNWLGDPVAGYRRGDEVYDARRDRDDLHLRSIKAVTGYHIQATDDKIGHVEDFLVQEADWSIHFLIVDTSNWWSGKRVLISPGLAHDINWTDKLVTLNVDRQRIENSPEYDAATVVDQKYEKGSLSHYADVWGKKASTGPAAERP